MHYLGADGALPKLLGCQYANAMENARAVVLGEALVDIVEKDGAKPQEYVGGSPLNVAVGLGRLGHPVTLNTWIGPDARGELIKQHCAASQVELAPGCDGAERTSTALAKVDAAGKAVYSFDLLWQVVPWPGEAKPLVAHTGSIGAVLPSGADAVAQLMQQAASSATLTYDPNVRPSVMGSPSQARGPIERLVGLSDLVKASDEDLAWLDPTVDPIDLARAWTKLGPAIVVVTRGGEGSVAVTRSGLEVSAPVATGVKVADTVGAGDSFMTGLIHSLWQRRLVGAEKRAQLAQIGADTLTGLLEDATRIAAITVSRPGANPPWANELEV